MTVKKDSHQYQLLKWRQANDSTTVDLVLSIQPKEMESPRKFKVKTSGEKFELYLNEVKVLDWILFDTVQGNPEWETHSEELHVALTKTSDDPWKSALRNPVAYPISTECEDSVMLTDNMINALLSTEICSFRKFQTQDKESASDLDSILENALAEDNESASWEQKYYASLTSEIKALRVKLTDGEETHKELAEKIINCDEQIIYAWSSNPSLNSVLDATELELMRLKLLSGDASEENEEYASSHEESLGANELFTQGILALERQNGAEGLHFLRLAALRYHHGQSVINLVRIYMESEMEAKALQILLQSARQSIDPLINFTMAQMFENGVCGIRPLFSLALYFYQRAASQGETTAMCFASALHQHGSCTAADGHHKVSGPQRAAQWMSYALDRGSVFAYKLKLELHLGMTKESGSSQLAQVFYDTTNIKPNYDEAQKYYQLLSDTSREMLKQIPQIEKRLKNIRTQEHIKSQKDSDLSNLHMGALGDAEVSYSDNQTLVKVPDARKTKLQRVSRAAREGMASPASTISQVHAIGRESCEKWALYAILTTSIYVLAFPLRVAVLPSVSRTFEEVTALFV